MITLTPPPVQECGCSDYAMSRRSFLGRLGAVGALAGLTSTGLATQMAFAAEPYTGDVLVVLSLRGGFDGLNTIVPSGDPRYAEVRPSIQIPQRTLLPLDSMFGLHPAMSPLMPWWHSGEFAAVQAVGMANQTRSHFEAMEEMERAAPGSSLRTGWLDRTLGLRDGTSAFQAVQMGSSMAASAFRGPSPELAMRSVDDFDLSGAWDATERRRWSDALTALHEGAPVTVGAPAMTTLGALAGAAQMQEADKLFMGLPGMPADAPPELASPLAVPRGYVLKAAEAQATAVERLQLVDLARAQVAQREAVEALKRALEAMPAQNQNDQGEGEPSDEEMEDEEEYEESEQDGDEQASEIMPEEPPEDEEFTAPKEAPEDILQEEQRNNMDRKKKRPGQYQPVDKDW